MQLRFASSLSIRTVCKQHRSSMCLRYLLGEYETDAGSTRLGRVERHKEVSGVRQSGPVVEYGDNDFVAYALPLDLYLSSTFA